MADKIRKNPKIKGIALPGVGVGEVKISQMADDTTLFLRDEESINEALNTIKTFGEYAGTRLNQQKTIGMWLGTWKNRQDKFRNIQFSIKPIKALGLYFGYNTELKNKLNWESKIEKLENVTKAWSMRNLSLPGRILLIKSLGISQVIYNASNLFTPDDIAKRINKIIFRFIWAGKRDKVKRMSIIRDREEGGLKMTDFRLLNRTLKIQSLNRILQEGNEKWKAIPRYYLNKGGPNYLILKVDPGSDLTFLNNQQMPNFYR